MTAWMEMRAIIKRFDEVICEKASKFAIDKIYNDIEVFHKIKDFDLYVKEHQKCHEEIMEKFRELDQGLNIVEISLSEELAIAMKKAEQDIKHRILTEIGGKPLNKKDIIKLIANKVEKTELYNSLSK